MSFFDEARFKKQEPEATYRKGQKVWADKRGWTVTTKTKFRRSFGEVKKNFKVSRLLGDGWNLEQR